MNIEDDEKGEGEEKKEEEFRAPITGYPEAEKPEEKPPAPEDLANNEQREAGERTVESEIKANIELWKSLGIEVDPEDVKKKLEALSEKPGFNWLFYLPPDTKEGLFATKDGEKHLVEKVAVKLDEMMSTEAWFSKGILKAPRMFSPESYAFATRYQQEPDAESIDENAKSARYWQEKTQDQYMNQLERILAEIRWFKENGTHLDNKHATMCPQCRDMNGNVPTYIWNYMTKKFSMDADKYFEAASSDRGVRKIITAEQPESEPQAQKKGWWPFGRKG